MVADTRTVGVTLGIDMAIALGCFSVFSLLRVARWSRRWYAPSRFRTADDAMAVAVGPPGHPPPGTPQPPPLPLTLLTWVWPLLRLREAEVLRATGGLDVAMYLRVIRFGLTFFSWVTLWCVGVVLPVNFSGGNLDSVLDANGDGAVDAPPQIKLGPGLTLDDLAQNVKNNTYVFSSLDKLSMANVAPGDTRLWVHLVSVYVVSIIAMRLLWRYSTEAVELRYRYLAAASPGAASRTVLVTDIPGLPQGTVLNRALQVVNGIFGWAIPGPWKRRVRESWERAFGVAYVRKAPSEDSGSSGFHAELAPGPVAEGRSGPQGADDPAAAAAGGSGHEGRREDEGFEGAEEFDEACTVRLSMADASEPPTARVSTLDDGAPGPAAGPAAAAGRGQGSGAGVRGPAGAGEVRQRTPDSATGLLAPPPRYSEAEAGAEGGAGRLRRWGREALGLVRRGGTRRHDEWRRAHERLVTGMGVEELVQQELSEVYGPGSLAAVMPACDSRGLAAAMHTYNIARTRLESSLYNCR